MTHRTPSPVRRRLGAAAAALALVAASVLGGAVVAAYAVGEPTFDQDTYSAALGTTVTIGGTGTTGDPVTVGGLDGQCANVPVAGDVWTCDVNTSNLSGAGDYTLSVSSAAFPTSQDTATLSIYAETGTITSPAARVTTLNTGGNLTVAGTTSVADGTTITVTAYYVYNNAQQVPLTPCTGGASGGIWTCELTGITTTSDLHLEASGSAPTSFATADVEVLLPPTINHDPDGTIRVIGNGQASFSGTHDQTWDGSPPKYSYVNIDIKTLGGTLVTTCTDGNREAPGWSCTTVDPLPYGAYDLFISQSPWWTTDSSYQAHYNLEVNEAPQPVAITSPTTSSLLTADSVTVTGTTGYASGTLTVKLQGATCTAAINGGAWTCALNLASFGSTAPSQALTVSRTAGGAALASVAVNVLRPPTVYGDDDSGNLISYTGAVSASGEGYLPDEGDGDTIITLSLTDGEGVNHTCSTTVYEVQGEGTYGAWDCSFPGTLPDGEYTVSITQRPSWATSASAPETRKVYVQIGGGGVDALSTCSFGPGSITVGGPAGYDATLYRVDPGSNYGASNIGECGGNPGIAYTDRFNDTEVGTFSGCDTSSSLGFSGSLAACTASGLTPGLWNIYYSDGDGGPHWDWFFRVPNAPTISAQPGVFDDRALFTGTGTPGDSVTVVTGAGGTLCTATVTNAGTWSCTADVGYGSASYYAYQRDASSGGASPFSLVSNVLTLAPIAPTPTPTPTPTATATPKPTPTPTWNPETFEWTFTADADGYHPGDPVTLTGAGLPPAALVEAEIHSTPVHLGTTIARANGSFIMNVVIPPDTPAGEHEFWVTITPVGGGTSTVVQPAKITIVGGPGTGTDDGGGGVPGAMGADRNDPGAPSSFTHGITTVGHLIVNPVAVAIAGGIGLALLLLVAFPAELLNSTLESQYDRFSKVLPKVRAPWWERFAEWVDKTPLVSASIMTLAASVIFGFADPGFGFDITSFRVVLGCFIALFIVGYLASIISGRILGRAWGFDTVLEVKPLTLILTVVGVVVSRLLDFSPGFLIGLLLGMALVGKRSKADEAKSTLVQTGVVFVMALLAWTAYSILSVTTVPDTFGSTLVFDTLVAITTEGMTALFIGLLPLKFLDGQGIFNYSKVLWAAVYAVVAFAFVAIVIPAADNWGDGGGSVALWLTIVGIFAALCVGIYLYFRFWAPPLPEEDEGEAQETKELVDSH
ncbi:MAG: hypothetical protein KKH51_13520 [Actinobacteria bacterium]|nr:hypothetical protein [Actinomycetota bacterium]